jgi:hypothetical protein
VLLESKAEDARLPMSQSQKSHALADFWCFLLIKRANPDSVHDYTGYEFWEGYFMEGTHMTSYHSILAVWLGLREVERPSAQLPGRAEAKAMKTVLFIGAKDALGTWAEGGSRENGGLLRLGC